MQIKPKRRLPVVKNMKFWQEYKQIEVGCSRFWQQNWRRRLRMDSRMSSAENGEHLVTAMVTDSRYPSAVTAACMDDLENILQWWEHLHVVGGHWQPPLGGWPADGRLPKATRNSRGSHRRPPAACNCFQRHVNVPSDLRRWRRIFSGNAGQWPFRISLNNDAPTRHHYRLLHGLGFPDVH